VKPPLVAPAATVTLAGTVTLVLLLDRPTLAPPVGAAALSVTVQEDVPGETTLDGLQLTLLTVSIPTTPAVPEPGIDEPTELTAVTLGTETVAEVSFVAAAMVSVIVARTPLFIAVSFIPKTSHAMVPTPLEQTILLLAAVAAAPGVTVRLEMSAAG
jgi:hypothetical protein